MTIPAVPIMPAWFLAQSAFLIIRKSVPGKCEEGTVWSSIFQLRAVLIGDLFLSFPKYPKFLYL